MDFLKHCRFPFGKYIQAYDNPVPMNTMQDQSTDSISLEPTGNAQGGYKFLSLENGKLITRTQWTDVPESDDIIRHVKELSHRNKQDGSITFANSN